MRVWLGTGSEGAMVAPDDATISAFDHGFTVGDGIFETMKAIDGRLFLWPWHLERLHTSADRMGIGLPADEVLTSIVTAVAAEYAHENNDTARVRLTISAGLGPLGSARLLSEPTVCCAATEIPVRSGSARLQVASWPRNERSPLAGVKSTSYAENVLALARARAANADESMFFNTAGELCEGTGANVFIVLGGQVLTPPVEAGLLAGVTRRFVLALADGVLDIQERTITREEFESAEEIFITSTFQDVRAVTAVDARQLAAGVVTAEVMRRFAAAAEQEWCWT